MAESKHVPRPLPKEGFAMSTNDHTTFATVARCASAGLLGARPPPRVGTIGVEKGVSSEAACRLGLGTGLPALGQAVPNARFQRGQNVARDPLEHRRLLLQHGIV